MLQEYKQLESRFTIRYIAHYIEDLLLSYETGLANKTYYSSYSEDCMDIYNQWDCIITTREHGARIAASLGIPSSLIDIDARADAGKRFHAKVVSPESSMAHPAGPVDMSELTSQIRDSRAAALESYKDLVTKHASALLGDT